MPGPTARPKGSNSAGFPYPGEIKKDRMSVSHPYRSILATVSALIMGGFALIVTSPVQAEDHAPKGTTMICVVEGMGTRVSEGTLCHRFERFLGVTMVMRDDPWAKDATGTVRVIGGDVDVLVAVAWRKHRIAWARRSWMELGSTYASILGMTVHELLPLAVLNQIKAVKKHEKSYNPASILRSEIIDPWVLSRMERGSGLLPWEATHPGQKRKKK
jgi:hypothetical protein